MAHSQERWRCIVDENVARNKEMYHAFSSADVNEISVEDFSLLGRNYIVSLPAATGIHELFHDQKFQRIIDELDPDYPNYAIENYAKVTELVKEAMIIVVTMQSEYKIAYHILNG
jgi:hypothetical protein